MQLTSSFVIGCCNILHLSNCIPVFSTCLVKSHPLSFSWTLQNLIPFYYSLSLTFYHVFVFFLNFLFPRLPLCIWLQIVPKCGLIHHFVQHQLEQLNSSWVFLGKILPPKHNNSFFLQDFQFHPWNILIGLFHHFKLCLNQAVSFNALRFIFPLCFNHHVHTCIAIEELVRLMLNICFRILKFGDVCSQFTPKFLCFPVSGNTYALTISCLLLLMSILTLSCLYNGTAIMVA